MMSRFKAEWIAKRMFNPECGPKVQVVSGEGRYGCVCLGEMLAGEECVWVRAAVVLAKWMGR